MKSINRVMIVSIIMCILTAIAHGDVLRVISNSSSVRHFYIDDTAVIRYVPDNYATIQEAIDGADHGDTILLSDGTYTGEGNKEIRYHGKAITVMSEHGNEQCIIDCEGVGRAFQFCGGEKTDSVLKGVTIRNGHVAHPEIGGGIRLHNSSATIADCVIQNCYGNYGGGLGGIATSPVIVNCTFKSNTANNYGSGIYLSVSPHVVINSCVIADHTAMAWVDGGGIYFESCHGLVTNCLIANNAATFGGGACFDHSTVLISNCTVTGNDASYAGGGLSFLYSFPVIENSILWDNQSPDGPEVEFGCCDLYSVGHIRYSDVKGGMSSIFVGPSSSFLWGEGMIDADPLFVSGPSGSCYLSLIDAGQSASSPCRNAGGDPSRSVYFQGSSGEMCMNQLTTRTDERTDINRVDMGFHHCPDTVLPPESPGGITPN